MTVFLKRILNLFLFSLVFIRCAEYQYAAVTTDSSVDNLGQIITENDSFRLSYFFSGQEGPARFQIYNKLERPLYINWDSSSLQLHSHAGKRLIKNTLFLNESASENKIRWHRKMSESADSIDITWGEKITMIPRKSEVKSDVIYLGSKFFRSSKSIVSKHAGVDSATNVKRYNKSDSPFRFKSNLVISSSADFRYSYLIAHDFWVDEVRVSQTRPVDMKLIADRKNVYFIKKPTLGTEIVGGFLILGGVSVLAFNRD